MTFSVVSQPQDTGCYDSGLEDSETPSSKSSSGPRLGALPLPEEGYERTTPEGSVGEEEHVENGQTQLPSLAVFFFPPFPRAHVHAGAFKTLTCHQGLRRCRTGVLS